MKSQGTRDAIKADASSTSRTRRDEDVARGARIELTDEQLASISGGALGEPPPLQIGTQPGGMSSGGGMAF